MTPQTNPASCRACHEGVTPPFDFSMAFQPIVDTVDGSVFAYEALVRGPHGEPAASVLSQVTPQNFYRFDQSCRVKAITLATGLGIAATGARLSINFMPEAVATPLGCLQLTLRTARDCGLPTDRIILEIVESEELRDVPHLCAIVEVCGRHGIQVALDDFGSGYSGLGLLTDVPTGIVKLDMELTRNLHQRPRSVTLIKSLVAITQAFEAQIIAEGVETLDEYHALQACGIRYMQGFLLGQPEFEALGASSLPG